MPIINLTQEALNRTKQPDVGWSPARLAKCSENASQKGNSTNYFFEFCCTGGPGADSDKNKGRYVTILFNSKTIGTDGSTPFPEIIDKFNKMVAALYGITPDEVEPNKYNSDDWVDRTCWIKVDNEVDYTGQLRCVITEFSPDSEIPF